jgi:hypothetical protein
MANSKGVEVGGNSAAMARVLGSSSVPKAPEVAVATLVMAPAPVSLLPVLWSSTFCCQSVVKPAIAPAPSQTIGRASSGSPARIPHSV